MRSCVCECVCVNACECVCVCVRVWVHACPLPSLPPSTSPDLFLPICLFLPVSNSPHELCTSPAPQTLAPLAPLAPLALPLPLPRPLPLPCLAPSKRRRLAGTPANASPSPSSCCILFVCGLWLLAGKTCFALLAPTTTTTTKAHFPFSACAKAT